MQTKVVRARAAVTVPVETGERTGAAALEGSSEDIGTHPSHSFTGADAGQGTKDRVGLTG